MNRLDRKILCTALAFLGVAMKGTNVGEDESRQVLRLAGLIDTFVAEHVPEPVAIESGNDETRADAWIDNHLNARRDRGETVLPADKATLITLYDRLQVRKARRMLRGFYAATTESKLADLVVKLLDEELEDAAPGDLA